MEKLSGLERLQRLRPAINEYQALATEHGISDIFQDNGGKILEMLLLLGLKGVPGRLGNDAVDSDGREFELKSLNIELQSQFTTHHHLTTVILQKYRKAGWYFAAYRNVELQAIYYVHPEALEPYFSDWEYKLQIKASKAKRGDDELEDDEEAPTMPHINNPKIHIWNVLNAGNLRWEIPGADQRLREYYMSPRRKGPKIKCGKDYNYRPNLLF